LFHLATGVNADASDAEISVANVVDAAEEAVDIALLRKDLDVLADGDQEGRVTFAKTSRYEFMTAGTNFGSMFS